MTAPFVPEIVTKARRRLILRAALLSLVWALATGWLVLAATAFLGPMLPAAALWLRRIAPVAVLAAVGLVLWRHRQARDPMRVALWLEERFPDLRYALVTLAEGKAQSPDLAAKLTAQAGAATAGGISVFGDLRPLLRGVLPVLALAALLQIAVAGGWQRGWSFSGAGTQTTAKAPVIDRLAELRAELVPPAYTGWPARGLETLDTVAGLAGSRLVLHGPGAAEGIEGRIGDDAPLAARPEDAGWALDVTLPGAPGGLVLTDGVSQRVIVLDPTADGTPLVRLLLPEHDEDLRTLPEMLELSARITDDIGIARGWFEVVVARGPESGDYGFSQETLIETAFDTREGALRGAVPFARFGLNPGDQISIRAIAEDANDVTGPGTGYSETRTIRLLRDLPEAEVKVNPAPPQIDESMMSLRMLIREIERMEARRPDMERRAYVAEVQPLRAQTETIRRKVQGFADEASEGGAFDVPELLSLALAEMWDASRDMAIAETDDALPHLRKAYEALTTLFNLTRYFLRGETLPAHADVDGVRMTGEEPVHASDRSPRPRADSPRDRLGTGLAALRGALDALLPELEEKVALAQVAALRDLPQAAPAYGALLAALRAGADPAPALADLRRVIEGAAPVSAAPPLWTPARGETE